MLLDSLVYKFVNAISRFLQRWLHVNRFDQLLWSYQLRLVYDVAMCVACVLASVASVLTDDIRHAYFFLPATLLWMTFTIRKFRNEHQVYVALKDISERFEEGHTLRPTTIAIYEQRIHAQGPNISVHVSMLFVLVGALIFVVTRKGLLSLSLPLLPITFDVWMGVVIACLWKSDDVDPDDRVGLTAGLPDKASAPVS